MSERKPWEIPMVYNDDRFVEAAHAESDSPADDGSTRGERDIEELLNRPDEKDEREYECNDMTPLNYEKGPHDDEFGVDEKDFDGPDADPIPYDKGPHDDEFGVEEDDLEPLDDETEFPDV